jgi:hypothetical protein
MTKARDLGSLLGASSQIDNTKITLDANEIPNLDASKITTGSLGTDKIPNLDASKIVSGTISNDRLNITEFDDNAIQTNLALLGFKIAVNGSLVKYDLKNQVIDEFNDSSGIDTGLSTNEFLATAGAIKYYTGVVLTSGGTITTTYNYTGSDSTISLSSGETLNGTVKLWGAAGGSDSTGSGKYGGGGGFISGTLNYLSDGTDIIVSVGQGGPMGTEGGAGGSGGGYAGLFLGSKTHGNSIIIAGSGGGAGDGNDGGQGGGSTGGAGEGTNAGQGGSQIAGGSASGTSSVWNPTAGSALQGGIGGNSRAGKSTATTAYNGGGYQGGEPGGQVGGGGGGGGYYGGGGGNNAGDGAGGGGGSNYYNASYISSVTNLGGGSPTTTSAGSGQTNKPFSTVGDGGTSTAGQHGGIWMSYTISTSAYDDMTLISNSTTAQSTPLEADLILLMENEAGTAVINTDIKGFISRDAGTTWTEGTLVDEGSWGVNKKILAFHDLDISAQPSGTSMKYKITTLNQSASKITNIHAVSIGWK